MYWGAFAMLALSLAGVALVWVAHRATAIWHPRLVSLPFLSGWLPEEHALSRFHVRWYLVTVVFLAFDVEMLFMYPWAVVVAELGASAVIEMFVFLGALLVAVAWARREGVFRWV